MGTFEGHNDTSDQSSPVVDGLMVILGLPSLSVSGAAQLPTLLSSCIDQTQTPNTKGPSEPRKPLPQFLQVLNKAITKLPDADTPILMSLLAPFFIPFKGALLSTLRSNS